MRLYKDRPDILTPGRWRFCPPGAIVTPTSVFFARRNDLDDTGDYALGEVYQRNYSWSNGKTQGRLTGLNYCGSSDVWLNGNLFGETLPLDQGGIPLCCKLGPPPPNPLLLGGSGRRVRVGHGVLMVGGGGLGFVKVSASVCTCMDVSSH